MRFRWMMVLLLLFSAGVVLAQQPGLSPELQEKILKADAARRQGNLDSAVQLLQEVVQSGGKIAEVYTTLGIVWQSKGENAKAVDSFRTAAQIDPKDSQPHLLAGTSLLALRRTGEAILELKKAVQLQPDHLLAREQLAQALARKGDWPGVVEQYLRLVEMRPENPEYRYQMGRAYGKYSLSCFEKLQSLNPSSARILQETGDQYLVQGNLGKAVESYEKARSADPSLPEIHFLLAQFYLKQGKREEALQAIEQALALTPGNPAAQGLLRQIQGSAATPR